MKVVKSSIKKVFLIEVDRLDPISIMLEDPQPRRGKIIIECYGESWTGVWGGMGDRNISQFFCSCDNQYLIGKIASQLNSMITDYDKVAGHAQKHVLKLRRDDEIDHEEARDLYDEVNSILFCLDEHSFGGDVRNLLYKIYGDDWWYSLPKQSNPDYEYLSRIVDAVKEGLKLSGEV